MMGIETVDSWRMKDARATCDSRKRLELQTSAKEQQCGLRWLGRTSPDRESVTKQSSVKEGGILNPVYQCKAAKSVGRPAGYSSVRTKAQRRPLESESQTGRATNSQAPANSRRGDAAMVHDHFKKEFIECLVSKAKQRTRLSSGSEAIIKAIEAQVNKDRAVLPADNQCRLANSLQPSEDRLVCKATSNAEFAPSAPHITSQETKRRTAPTENRYRDAFKMSTRDTSSENKASEQSRSRITAGDESTRHGVSAGTFETHINAVTSNFGEDFDRSSDEKPCASKDSPTTEDSPHKHAQKSYQGARDLDFGQQGFLRNHEVHDVGQSKTMKVNGGAGDVEECKMSSHQMTRACVDTSPGSSPSGRKLWSLENGKDSLNMLRKKLDSKRNFDDSRSKSRNGPQKHEYSTKVGSTDGPLLSPASNGASPAENESMLRSLRLAAAIDQAHFLRALQSAGAVQISTPRGADCERAGQPSSTAKPSSTKDVKNSKNVQEGKSKYTQQADALECQCGATAATIAAGTRSSEGAVSVRRRVSSNGSTIAPSNCPLNAKENSRVRLDGLQHIAKSRVSRESSHRSSMASEDCDTSSGTSNSILQVLMKKVSIRSSLTSQSDESQTSGPASPVSLPTATPRASSELEQWLRTSNVSRSLTDLKKLHLESPPPGSTGIPSSTFSGSSARLSFWDPISAEDLPAHSQDNHTARSAVIDAPRERAKFMSTEIAAAGRADIGNGIRSAPSEPVPTGGESQSSSAAPPPLCDLQKCETTLDLCHTLAVPEQKLNKGPIEGNPRSPGSDDSGSEAFGGTDHSSPVSVLSFQSGRLPLQDDNRLTPLEQKLQELHERIHKSKRDVSKQKRANLEKERTARQELKLRGFEVVDSTFQEMSLIENASKPSQGPDSVVKSPRFDSETQAEGKFAVPSRSPIFKNEVLHFIVPAFNQLDTSRSLESFDLRKVPSCTEELRWDLVYVRDLLLVSTFGQDEYKGTKWHSVTMPMNPGLFDNLEAYYEKGKNFPGSHILRRLALSQDDHLRLRKRIRGVHLNPTSDHQKFVDSMNRCQLFDAVNEMLVKRLVPHIAAPRPWITSWARPIMRPQSTQSGLLLELWSDISSQIGKNGSMTMDKIKLHQSLEEMVRYDLNNRSHLFPSRELERAAERIGLEIDRRILEELIDETIVHLSQLGDPLWTEKE